MWLSQTEENDPEPAWFGAEAADADAAHEALTDENQWPVIRIPFGAGHTVVIGGRNSSEDEGTEYYLSHPEWDRDGHLATIDGHQAGPGLSWQELAHIAGTPDENAPGVHAPHARLLLLLPVLGDADLPGEAVDMVADALVRTGTADANASSLAQALLHDHPLWEPAAWSLAPGSPLSGSWDPAPRILLLRRARKPALRSPSHHGHHPRPTRATGQGTGHLARPMTDEPTDTRTRQPAARTDAFPELGNTRPLADRPFLGLANKRY